MNWLTNYIEHRNATRRLMLVRRVNRESTAMARLDEARLNLDRQVDEMPVGGERCKICRSERKL